MDDIISLLKLEDSDVEIESVTEENHTKIITLSGKSNLLRVCQKLEPSATPSIPEAFLPIPALLTTIFNCPKCDDTYSAVLLTDF